MSGLSAALGCTYGEILDYDKGITAAICIILETINTAKALGIKMEPMQGVDPSILLDVAKQDMENAKNVVKLVWGPHRDLKASMLQDLEKGLPCEIEALNGYLSRMSAEASVATPVNDKVTEIIRDIQAGKLHYEFSNLDRIEVPDLSIYF
jgi:2-dehydropantoate 2-reductase